MIISTGHLIPSPGVPPTQPHVPMITPTFSVVMGSTLDGDHGRPVFSVTPQTAQANSSTEQPLPQVGTFSGKPQPKFISLNPSHFGSGNTDNNSVADSATVADNVTSDGNTALLSSASGNNELASEEPNPPDPSASASSCVISPLFFIPPVTEMCTQLTSLMASK